MDKTYWKRYFDDERRNKIEKNNISTTSRNSNIKYEKSSLEQNQIYSLKEELKTYKILFYKEQNDHNETISKLYKEIENKNKYKSNINKIKKILENS